MKLSNVFIFGIGIAIGSAITYKIVSDKYESLINEEIESVKESLGYYDKKHNDEVIDENVENPTKVFDPLKIEKKDYENMVSYYKYHTPDEKVEEVDDPIGVDPAEMEHPGLEFYRVNTDVPDHSLKANIYVIPPEEYGVLLDYDMIDLTHYNDGVLCDDMDEIVEDIDDKVGRDYVNHFGDFDEPDVIHVRNDILRCDYEITRDLRNYGEIGFVKPPHYDV